MTYLSGTAIKLLVQIRYVLQTVCIEVLKSQSTAENVQNHPLCNCIEARGIMPVRHLSRLWAHFNLCDSRTKALSSMNSDKSSHKRMQGTGTQNALVTSSSPKRD